MTYVKYEGKKKRKKDIMGAPVICLHGFPDNPDTFVNLAQEIANQGHDVYVPYLRGYEVGTSKIGSSFDCKNEVSDDIIMFIDSLELDRRIHLVGHDWGAFIVSVLAKKIPKSVLSVTMMAVPHNFIAGIMSFPRQLILSWYMFFFQIPILPERWLLSWGGFEKLVSSWYVKLSVCVQQQQQQHTNLRSPDWKPPQRFLRSVKSTLRGPGVATCALSYYRHFLGVPHLLAAALLPIVWIFAMSIAIIVSMLKPDMIYNIWILSGDRSIRVPTLGLTGSNDGCIDTRLFHLGMTKHPELFPKGVRVVRVKNCGHWLHLERPDVVIKVIKEHIRDSEK